MFTTPAQTLSRALALVLATAETKTTMPVLAYVLVEGRDGVLKLTATDINLAIETYLETTECGDDFAWCVAGKPLADLTKLLSGDVTLIESKGRVVVTSGDAEHLLPLLPADQFPAIEAAQTVIGNIDGALLAKMLSLALLGAETNPNGIDWQKNIEVVGKDGTLTITGCSNARISSVSVKFSGEVSAVIPQRAAGVLKTFAASAESVSVACSNNLFTLRTETGAAHSRLSALGMADWRMIMKADYPHRVELASDALLLPLRRAILASDTDIVNIALSQSQMTISGRNTDTNQQASEPVPVTCPSLNGSTHILRLMGNQLLDFFRECETGVFEISPREGGHSDLRLQPQGEMDCDCDWVYVPTTLRVVG
jgi:DNA polymerase III subunit beta